MAIATVQLKLSEAVKLTPDQAELLKASQSTRRWWVVLDTHNLHKLHVLVLDIPTDLQRQINLNRFCEGGVVEGISSCRKHHFQQMWWGFPNGSRRLWRNAVHNLEFHWRRLWRLGRKCIGLNYVPSDLRVIGVKYSKMGYWYSSLRKAHLQGHNTD